MRWAAGWAWLALTAIGLAAHAESEPDRIGREREQANLHYAEQQRDCLKRFIAAPCLEAARTEHRTTLTRLRQQQIQIDEQARREATEARRRTIEAAAARAERDRRTARDTEAKSASSSSKRAEPASGAGRSIDTPTHLFPARSALPRGHGPANAATEREKTERFEARNREAAEHRDKVLQRNAERAARGKPVAPLPAPSPSGEAASAVR